MRFMTTLEISLRPSIMFSLKNNYFYFEVIIFSFKRLGMDKVSESQFETTIVQNTLIQ